jgi:limonene-1,2-epoxide hydrolase
MIAVLFAVLASVAQVQQPLVITPEEAANHIGEVVVVRGKISQIVLSVNLTTHINFGGLYPNHVFTATILKAKQTLFTGVRDYEGKDVQVQGRVHLYKGKPEIMLTERAQIRLAEDSLSAADLSGTWNVDGDVIGNSVKITCVLKQDGEALSGTARIEGADSQDVPVKGSIQGRAVTFQIDVPAQGASHTNVFSGRLDADGIIRGAIAVANVGGTFTARKQ